MKKLKESNFQFKNPSLFGFNFKVNKENFDDKNVDNLEFDIKANVKMNKTDNQNEYIVFLELDVNNVNEEFKPTEAYKIYLEIGALFIFENEHLEDNEIEKLLNINAPAVLLSYARPTIANITQQSIYGTLNLPFMNFNEKD